MSNDEQDRVKADLLLEIHRTKQELACYRSKRVPGRTPLIQPF